jgi:hypothetical protein
MAYVPPRRSRISARHRALELLAASPEGYTEAMLLAHGISVELMADLIHIGFASAAPERIMAGGKSIEVERVRITEAGRKALQ